jgi:hypothetical protein
MTVQVRGVTSALSGTQTVPAGVVAGDLLVTVLRSFYEGSTDATPFSALSGWTFEDNFLWGKPAGGTLLAATWGVGTATRTATASEPASSTFVSGTAEQIGGAMIALYSDTGQALTYQRSGTNSGPFGSRFTSWFYTDPHVGMAVVHVLMGLGSAVSDYVGFTGTRTHHATLTWHSDTPFSDSSPPSGPGTYYENDRDIAMSVDTETGTITVADRSVLSNRPTSGGGTYWSNTWVIVYETGPLPVVGGWMGWIID